MAEKSAARIMDGSVHAQDLLAGYARRAAAFTAKANRSPCLAAVLVGEDPSSLTYVKMKQRRCAQAGVEVRFVGLPGTSTTAQVVPEKDVDGVTMHSFASMAFNLPGFASCTPAGIMHLLDAYSVDPSGKHAVVIGRSPILGKPIGMLLLARDATVTYCHSHTRGLSEIVRTADILVAAVGKPRIVRGHWLKPGAVVVDAGYSGHVGDVDQEEASAVASLITPVPGGVGPMTIAMLIGQTVTAAEQSRALT